MASTYSLQYKRRERHTIQAVQNEALKQRIVRGYFLQISVVFVAYLVAGKLGQATANIRSSNLGPVWPAYGIALAAILICGYRVWFGVAAGAFLVAFFSPVSHVAALGQAAGATLAATTGAFLLHRIANFQPSLSRLSDVLSLIAFGGFGSAMVSASIGVSVLYATHTHAYSGLGAAWLIYWLGDATGVLLVTPLALRFADFSKLRARDRITELAILLLLLAATCSVIFGDLPFIPVKLHFMAFAVLPLIMWAAIRFSVGVTAFSILIVAAVATVGTALGSGPFTSNTTFVNAVLLDVFFGVLSVSGLSLAAVIAERENAEREREQVVSKQAAMEARLRADEALRESEERLRLAQQAARIGTFDWNIRTGVNTWTPQLEAMYGLPPGGFGGTQTAFENLVHPDDRAGVLNLVDAAMKSGQPTEGEWRVVWADGSVHWIAGHWQVFMDASGEPSKIIGVNIDATERKRAEEALQQREMELTEAQRLAGVGSWQWEPRTDTVIWSKELYCLMGIDPTLPAPSYKEHVHLFAAESWERLQRAVQGALQTGTSYELDLEVVRPESIAKWEIARGEPVRDKSGQISGLRGTVQDITERKQAEEALSSMSRKLIGSQEQERTRIGRELHDDIGQRLALVAVELQQLHENSVILPEVRSRMGELQKQISEIAADTQSLSHQLHSAKLQYLGIAAAMRGFCREFGEQQKLEIDFNAHNLSSPVPPDISLCLFRVLQEALHNSAKHSGVRHFEVRLWGTSEEIHLSVKDSGAGFDREAAKESRGLGLISMEERLKLVKGTLSINSQPKGGTTIHARVPFDSSSDSARAAG